MPSFLVAGPLLFASSLDGFARSLVDRCLMQPGYVATEALAVTLAMSWYVGSTRGRVACVAAAAAAIASRCLVPILPFFVDALRRAGVSQFLGTFAEGGGGSRADALIAVLAAIVLAVATHRQYVVSLVPLSCLWLALAGDRGTLPAASLLASVLAGALGAALVEMRPVSSFLKRATFALTMFERALVGRATYGRRVGGRTRWK